MIWRFSDARKYTQLSAAEFLRFRPLPESESLKYWQQFVYPDSSLGHRHLTELYVGKKLQWPESVSFRSESEAEEEQVVDRLRREIAANESSEVLFFWNGVEAVSTDWGLFLDHWDDFCYPSDDSNILLLPVERKAVTYIEERWSVLNWKADGPVFAGGRR